MFEQTEVVAKVSKEVFEEQEPQLRLDLINAQFDLRKADFPVILVVTGNDRVGVNRLIDRLHEWMDARYINTHIFGKPTEEERERPRFWRYWHTLPPDGQIGLYGGAWPLNAVANRAADKLDKRQFAQRLQHICNFERELAAEGALILKFWVHLPYKEMKKRVKAARKNPDRIWWMEDVDYTILENYKEYSQPTEQMVKATDCDVAPWFLVDGTDERFRDLTVTTIIRDTLQGRLQETPSTEGSASPTVTVTAQPQPQAIAPEAHDYLDQVDLTQKIEKSDYKEQLEKYQRKLYHIMYDAWQKKRSSVFAFEGWDAAGKGGVIRRISGALPARAYRLVPIAAPTPLELQHHYLWRFWKHLPRAGNMLIFDRSWYGRVLVERVEHFATEQEWRRAYDEINDFEAQLVDHGVPVLKFWLHISPEEQLRRFKAREQTDYKKYKITDEDYRNREKWDTYTLAVNEMVARTDTKAAPWQIVPANDKRFARIQVLKTACKVLGKAWKSD